MIDNAYLDAALAGAAARHELAALHEVADSARLARAYRSTHPQPTLRSRSAALLRRAADRLAAEPARPAGQPALYRPSVSHR